MNWNDLNEIWERCKSKSMTVKEAQDFVSMTYHLISFHGRFKHLFPNYEEEHEKLIQFSIAIYKRAHEKQETS